jgi:hypothetical protein
MASDNAPTESEASSERSIEEVPPVYDDATGVLNLRQEGLNTLTKVAGTLPSY